MRVHGNIFTTVKVYTVEIAATLIFVVFMCVETVGMIRHLLGK